MRRAYTVSPCGLVGEIFSDGHIMLVGKVRPGFWIAHMIGARGESPDKYVMIHWQDGWLDQLKQQKAVEDYCASRVIPIVNCNVPLLHWEQPEQGYTSNCKPFAFNDHDHVEAGHNDFIEDEPDVNLEDLMASLSAVCTFGSPEELREQALRIYALRTGA